MQHDRFLAAQEPLYAHVLEELRAGDKKTHWMWFIFPQLKALGRSSTALFYGLNDLADARMYFSHPVLGARLKECTALVLQHHDKSALEILHHPDNLKFRSCMTLFQLAAPQEPLFAEALKVFFKGDADDMTIQLVNRMPG
ncbi:DUF1810 domain-containing protein [Rhodoferax sp. TS-BS-61-7]|uniref:DUF1810 domain-containing protein n=1 Tax=Rhodoferax sp. TS-BS-61-7 TaxID=2094194 RepID=UPI000CF65F01|nr:DUF1810 domain-containing protein [Rhodoferax sp. TS-BS-61-7]PQA79209.1 DUF1810 domain-containing protein [Rhodoferax sp. TS-BS-61-7]